MPIGISTCEDGLRDPRFSIGGNAEDDRWDLDDFLDPDTPSPLLLGEMPIADGIANFMRGNDGFFGG